jgi:hypothetical protein
MKSLLFSDAVKCNVSLGRNTTSRQAILRERKSIAARPRQLTTTIQQQPLQSHLLVERRNATSNVMRSHLNCLRQTSLNVNNK